jgi:outer membrane protein assembly factor BamB
MKGARLLILLSLLFVLAAGTALVLVLTNSSEKSASLAPVPLQKTPVLWRSKCPPLLNPPTRLADGWLLTTPQGELVSLTAAGVVRWKFVDTNAVWQASAQVDRETVCAVTRNGALSTFHATTGEHRWKRETGLTCLHPPCVTELNNECVLILLSQEDGTLLCLTAKDGELRWRSPATNRTDGPPLCLDQTIAYGNCDATVYLFALTNGHLKGSIPLNNDEQIAGALLPLPTGNVVVGTRAGTLVLLDPNTLTCLSRINLSDSETFATPALIAPDHMAMPTPEGKLTFWNFQQTNLVAAGEIQLATRFDETAFHDGVFWALAERTLLAIRLSDKKELFRTSPGDVLANLSPGSDGQCLLSADGELLCVKGF